MSGISDLTKGYRVYRPSCVHHFIGMITRGKATCWDDGRPGEIGRGTVFFFRAGTLHHYASSSAFSMIWYHLDPGHPHWRHLAHRQNFSRPARALHRTIELLERSFSESQSPVEVSDAVPMAISRLILAYLDREFGHDPSDPVLVVRERLEKVWNAVARDLAGDWDVRSLAKSAGMSLSHFHAEVMFAYRKPPMKIVRKFRIEYARALLLNTDYTLDAIADRTGYRSAFAFSRAFKATMGVSPRPFRQGAGVAGSMRGDAPRDRPRAAG